MEEIDVIHNRITSVDRQILQALAERRRLAVHILQAKAQAGMPVRDGAREERMLAELIAAGRDAGLDAHFVTRIFHEIIDDALRCQQMELVAEPAPGLKRVAYQGIEGAYSEAAARRHFDPFLDCTAFVGFPTFERVVDAVEEGETDYGILPAENTTAGSINEVHDLLSCVRLAIVGEEIFRVEHCLLAVRDVPPADIRCILSHPQALAQCMKFLSQLPHCEARAYPDTAMVVKKVKEEGRPELAAIAGEDAARLYGLHVLRRNVEDHRDNFTRFVIVARKPCRSMCASPARRRW